MRFTKTEIGKIIAPLSPVIVRGLNQWQEGDLLDPTNGQILFSIVTGGNGVDDLASTDTLLTLLNNYDVPADKRIYLTGASLSIQTPGTLWAGGYSIDLIDGTGALLASSPIASQRGIFGSIAGLSPWSKTASSYNSSTGVITFPANSLVNGAMTGIPFDVASGAGAGYVAGIIESNTATTLTPKGGAAAIQQVLDNTSVIRFHYIPVTSATATSITCSKAAWAAGTLINRYAVVLAGTGVGQNARITANDATSLTVESMGTTLDSTSVIAICLVPGGSYFINLSGSKPVASLGSGLFARVNGAMNAGSDERLTVSGFIA